MLSVRAAAESCQDWPADLDSLPAPKASAVVVNNLGEGPAIEEASGRFLLWALAQEPDLAQLHAGDTQADAIEFFQKQVDEPGPAQVVAHLGLGRHVLDERGDSRGIELRLNVILLEEYNILVPHRMVIAFGLPIAAFYPKISCLPLPKM